MGIRAAAGATGKVRCHRVAGGSGGSGPPPPDPEYYSTWSTTDKDADVTLAQGDLFAGIAAAQGMARGAASVSTGGSDVYQYECRMYTDAIQVFGVAKSTASLTAFPGADANGWGYYPNAPEKYNAGAGAAYGSTASINDIMGLTFDSATGTLVFYKNGVSQGTAFTGLSGTFFPAWGPGSGAGNRGLVLNTGYADFLYPVGGAIPWGGVTTKTSMWNPMLSTISNSASRYVLSNVNKTATTPGGFDGLVVGSVGHSSGSYYFELVVTASTSISGSSVGLAKSTVNSNYFPGQDPSGVSWGYTGGAQKYVGGSATAYGASYAINDVIGVHYNSGSLTFYKNGVSQGEAFTGITGTIYPAWGNSSSSTATVRMIASEFTQPIPSGASAWSEV